MYGSKPNHDHLAINFNGSSHSAYSTRSAGALSLSTQQLSTGMPMHPNALQCHASNQSVLSVAAVVKRSAERKSDESWCPSGRANSAERNGMTRYDTFHSPLPLLPYVRMPQAKASLRKPKPPIPMLPFQVLTFHRLIVLIATPCSGSIPSNPTLKKNLNHPFTPPLHSKAPDLLYSR